MDPIPVSQSAVENSTAHIELPGLSSDASCTWQISTKEGWVDLEENSSYKGVNTPQLKIVGVKTSMDGDLYRGLITNTICEEGTNTSELFVTTSTIDDLYSKSSYMNVFPNPSDEFINCIFNESIQKGNLIITNLNGNLVKRIDLENIVSGQKLSVNTENIASGIYILRLFSGNNLLENSKVIVQ